MQPIKLRGYHPNGTDTRTTVSTSIIEPSTIMGTPDDETTHFLVNVQSQPVMVTFDGSDPTASNGHLFSSGYQDFWPKQMLAKARWIRQGASDGTVHVTPFQ